MKSLPRDFSDQQQRWLIDLCNNLDREIRVSTVSVYSNTNVTAVGAGVATTMAWNGDTLDNALMHSTSVNNSRLIAPETGIYEVAAQVLVDSAVATQYSLQVKVNGVARVTLDYPYCNTNNKLMLKGVTLLSLSRDDYVELVINSTGAYNYYGNTFSPLCSQAYMRKSLR